MQNNAPVPVGQPQQPEDPKLAKQRKREEAERQKKLQQEKKRQQELNLLVSNFGKSITNSVMDVPTMYKYACTSLKTMLQVDHVAVAMFTEEPEIRPGEVCVFKAESALPKIATKTNEEKAKEAKKKIEEPEFIIKRTLIGDEVIETKVKVERKPQEKSIEIEPEPPRIKPMFPVPPRQPIKPGTLPRLENIIIDAPLVFKMREIKQPAMIHDISKFPDPELAKFAEIFLIKSMLIIPFMSYKVDGKEEVSGVFVVITVNENKALSQLEISTAQKLVNSLSKYVTTAPPDLPVNVNKAIKAISKDENSDKLLDFYSSTFDDIFDLIVFELGWDNCSDNFKRLYDERDKLEDESKLKKIWFQIDELIKSPGDFGSIARRAIQELYIQADDFVVAKSGIIPSGFRSIFLYTKKNLKYSELDAIKLPDETYESLETQIDNALRGKAIFTEKTKATLINDVEQSNMLINYIAAPASVDFRNHIKAAVEEYDDFPDELDKEANLTDMTYYGMAEISRAICADLVEKVLLEIPKYLEQTPEEQAEQNEALTTHYHRKVMSNLITSLKGKKNVWVNYIIDSMKEQAKEAAKKRAVVIGRMQSDYSEEED